MAYVVTDACIRCKYTDCVEVCPVDCFHEGPNFLVIDPDECIDCTLCVAECPVAAIMAETDVPPELQSFIALNAELARRRRGNRSTGATGRCGQPPREHCRTLAGTTCGTGAGRERQPRRKPFG